MEFYGTFLKISVQSKKISVCFRWNERRKSMVHFNKNKKGTMKEIIKEVSYLHEY